MMAFSSISTYVIRAVTWPSDSDNFLVNLQSSEQATKRIQVRARNRAQRRACLLPAKYFPARLCFMFSLGLRRRAEMEKEPRTEIPLLAGRRARWRAAGLQAEAALCPAVCLAGVLGRYYISCRVPLALRSPASPPAPAASKSKVRWQGRQGCAGHNLHQSSSLPGTGTGAALVFGATPLPPWIRKLCPPSTQPLRKTSSENSWRGTSHFPLFKSWIFWVWSKRQGRGNLSFCSGVCVCLSPTRAGIRLLLWCWH